MAVGVWCPQLHRAGCGESPPYIRGSDIVLAHMSSEGWHCDAVPCEMATHSGGVYAGCLVVTRVSQEPFLWSELIPFLMMYSLDDISAAAPSEELVPLFYRYPCNIIGLWNLRSTDVQVTLGPPRTYY